MLSRCNEINADSIRTPSGTVVKTLKENYVCGDWDNFKKYVIENDAIELLQQSGKKILDWKNFLNGYKKSLSGKTFNRE